MTGINTAHDFEDVDDIAGLKQSTQQERGHDWTKAGMFGNFDFGDTWEPRFPAQEIACSGSVDDIDERHVTAVRARIENTIGNF